MPRTLLSPSRPLGTAPASSTLTRKPAAESRRAATSPATPAPITMTLLSLMLQIRNRRSSQPFTKINCVLAGDALAGEFGLAAEGHGRVDAQPAPMVLVRIA